MVILGDKIKTADQIQSSITRIAYQIYENNINENELLSSLKPIMQSNSLWKNTVSNYIKKYYLSKGELNKAKNFDISNN